MSTKNSLPQASCREAGFTLLELLVAVTLLGLLSVVLFGSLRFGTRVWERSESATVAETKIRNVQLNLAGELARAYPLLVSTEASEAHISFDGRKDRLSFLTPDRANIGAMLRITIQVEQDQDDAVVTKTQSPELAGTSDARSTILLHHIKTLAIAYFGSQKSDEPPAWHDEWRERTNFPQLIRIRIAFDNGITAYWPDLIVAPKIAADVGCVFDPLTKFCRGR